MLGEFCETNNNAIRSAFTVATIAIEGKHDMLAGNDSKTARSTPINWRHIIIGATFDERTRVSAQILAKERSLWCDSR
jgi:hypothetical protein